MMRPESPRSPWLAAMLGLALLAGPASIAEGQDDAPTPTPLPAGLPPELREKLMASMPGPSPDRDEFPSLEKVTEGYEQVVSMLEGKPSFYTLWVRKSDGQMLAELPRDYMRQKHTSP